MAATMIRRIDAALAAAMIRRLDVAPAAAMIRRIDVALAAAMIRSTKSRCDWDRKARNCRARPSYPAANFFENKQNLFSTFHRIF